MTNKESKYYYDKLKEHLGHAIEITHYSAKYSDPSDDTNVTAENISIECLDCNEVLIDFEK
jgi:hypothetical protein